MCVGIYTSASTPGGQKRVLDPLERELQVAVSHPTQVFWKAAIAPNLLSHLSNPSCEIFS